MMSPAGVTIVVVPRQRFSQTIASFESIYANTSPGFKLIYVDAGSPPHVARYLRNQVRLKDFMLIRSNRFLSANQARNLALDYVETDYVAFLENEVIVWPGWLDALLQCAEETSAWVVGGLCIIGEPGRESVHYAGAIAHVEEVDGKRCYFDQRPFLHTAFKELPPLQRTRTEMAEFHCMLVRAECFDELGKLDEHLPSFFPDKDFGMSVNEAGGEIYFEPRAIASLLPEGLIKWSDVPLFTLRWSDAWNDASLRRFHEKWRLPADDVATVDCHAWGAKVRQSFLSRLRPVVDRFTVGRSFLIEKKILGPLETRLSNLAARRAARRKSRIRILVGNKRTAAASRFNHQPRL
jgi:GT2 family glycosyltransferase